MTPMDEIKNLIEEKLPNSIAEVGDLTGTMDHLDVLVACDEFKGKMLIDQHQMIMDILKEPLQERVHAVKIKTMTMEKYKANKE